MTKYKTAESVRRGHPDKLCDLIADSILDECLRHDRYSRCACEVMATKGKIFVCGEITCAAKINIRSVVRDRVARPERIDGFHFAQNASRVLQKQRAALRRAHALTGALKYRKPGRFLHVAQDAAQVRLAEKKILRGLGDRTSALDLNDILQMLGIHRHPPWRFGAANAISSVRWEKNRRPYKNGVCARKHVRRIPKLFFIILYPFCFFKRNGKGRKSAKKKACIFRENRL